MTRNFGGAVASAHGLGEPGAVLGDAWRPLETSVAGVSAPGKRDKAADGGCQSPEGGHAARLGALVRCTFKFMF